MDFEGELDYSDSEAGSHDGWSLEDGEMNTERRGLKCIFEEKGRIFVRGA